MTRDPIDGVDTVAAMLNRWAWTGVGLATFAVVLGVGVTFDAPLVGSLPTLIGVDDEPAPARSEVLLEPTTAPPATTSSTAPASSSTTTVPAVSSSTSAAPAGSSSSVTVEANGPGLEPGPGPTLAPLPDPTTAPIVPVPDVTPQPSLLPDPDPTKPTTRPIEPVPDVTPQPSLLPDPTTTTAPA